MTKDKLQKNFDTFIETAKNTLAECCYLTEKDRSDIEGGMWHLVCGYTQFKGSDPETRDAAAMLMIGAFYIGSRCIVSKSEAKYWDIKKHGSQGDALAALSRTRAAMWRGAVDQRVAEKIAASGLQWTAAGLGRTLKKEQEKQAGKPGAFIYPDIKRLTEYISKARNAVGKNSGKHLRLVTTQRVK